jgi:hypothetical protein
MSFQCSCPECGYRYEVAGELAGKSVLCPECQTRFKPEGMRQASPRPPGLRQARKRVPEPPETVKPVEHVQAAPRGMSGAAVVVVLFAALAVVAAVVVTGTLISLNAPGSPAKIDPGEMTLKEFILQEPKHPVKVRVECRLDTFYNRDYIHARETHYSLDLKNATGPYASAYGYIARSSADGKRLYELLKSGRSLVLTLHLHHVGPDGQPGTDPGEFAVLRVVD